MNLLQIKDWSERQQVFTVILLVGGLIFAVSYFLLYPQNRQRRALENDIAGMRNQLSRRGLDLDEDNLLKKKSEEETRCKSLLDEWRASVLRLAAFPGQKQLATDPISHIQFKEALFNTRQRLARKSRDAGIRFPYHLGIDDSVSTDQEPRRLMLQLRAVEKLADVALDLGVLSVQDVKPLPPVLHNIGEDPEAYFEEYPVLVDFQGTLENLFGLFGAVLEPGHVFFLKNLRIENAASEDVQTLLRIRAVFSACVFFKDPSELKQIPRKVFWKSGPRGA